MWFNIKEFRAILCDLDGVITQTAGLHAVAWKQLFDDYLQQLSARRRSRLNPFDLEEDYRLYVDGKPRHDGVRDFLASRGVNLPLGSPNDSPDRETLYGLGNRKDTHFKSVLHETGVIAYPETVKFLRLTSAMGMKMAVVSSSHHCAEIIEAVGLSSLFEVRVDGHEIDRLQLSGKPAPDSFLEAARRMSVSPRHGIVIEDALAGVRAGREGGFGLVIGVDRQDQAQALRHQGANIVVSDLGELLPSLNQPEPSSIPSTSA